MERKKPYTTTELFDTVCKKLKDKELMPEILDYALGSHKEDEIRYYEYRIENRLDFGGNEGIYLDIEIKLYYPTEDLKEVTYHLGTFKTLDTTPEAMRTMGALLGDFITETSDFINSNIDDFTWFGYEVRGYTADGRRAMGYEVPTEKRALEKKDSFFEKHAGEACRVTITNNATKAESTYCQYPDGKEAAV